jgi:hypothetical protein
MTCSRGFVRQWIGLFLLIQCGALILINCGQIGADTGIVLSWSRQGGFAGFCDELKVTGVGEATASSCKTTGARTRTLSREELQRLNQWREALAKVTITEKDEATADVMTRTLTLTGRGNRQPSDRDKRELLDWAQDVYQRTAR